MKNFKHLFLLFALLSAPIFLQAQAEGCDGMRYLDVVFDDVEVTTVQYGENVDYQDNTVQLFMDIYQPVGDAVTQRPVAVMAHGGAWIGGTKEDMSAFCFALAQRGYVAASISYRLYEPDLFNIPDSIGAVDILLKSVGDMKAAIRYMRQDAATDNLYKIDPTRIFAGGASAGAIMATHVGYMDENDEIPDFVLEVVEANGGFEGSSGDEENLTYSSEVQGVMSLSGALYKRAWMNEGDVPLVILHGTEDDIVPYAHGFLGVNVNGFELDLMSMDGGSVLAARAEETAIPYYFQAVEGGMHDDIYFASAFEEDFNQFLDSSYLFFHDVLCAEPSANVEQLLDVQISIQPNPSNSITRVQIEGLNEAVLVTILNQLGQVIQRFEPNNSTFELDKNVFESGIYYLYFEGKESGKIKTKKLVFME